MADEPEKPTTPIPSRRVTPKGSPASTTPTTRAAARKAAADQKATATTRTGDRKPLAKKTVEKTADPKVAARSGDPRKKASTTIESSRYTAPVPHAYKVSPWYVPAFMFGFLALGMIIIFLNYMGWPFTEASNWRLLGGLGCILAGILVATRYH